MLTLTFTTQKTGTVEYNAVALRSPSVVMDLKAAADVQPHRALAAAIGLCAPLIVKQFEFRTYAQCGYQTLLWGGAIWDKFIELGVSESEIIEAGKACLQAMVAEVEALKAEVESAETFTDATQSDSPPPA